MVHEGSLGRVEDFCLALLLEEALAHSLVHENQSDVRVLCLTVYFLDDLLQLVKLVMNDLLSHGIANSVSVHKDVFRHRATIVVFVRLKGVDEVVQQNLLGNDLLTLDLLGTSLGVVLAHMLIVRSAETNDRLFSLMADINSNEHSFLRNFRVEVHSPQITT